MSKILHLEDVADSRVVDHGFLRGRSDDASHSDGAAKHQPHRGGAGGRVSRLVQRAEDAEKVGAPTADLDEG